MDKHIFEQLFGRAERFWKKSLKIYMNKIDQIKALHIFTSRNFWKTIIDAFKDFLQINLMICAIFLYFIGLPNVAGVGNKLKTPKYTINMFTSIVIFPPILSISIFILFTFVAKNILSLLIYFLTRHFQSENIQSLYETPRLC